MKSSTEFCLTVLCLYFIILYNTTVMSHLKGKSAIESKRDLDIFENWNTWYNWAAYA